MGDSHIDEERLENLKELKEVLEYAINQMILVASYRDCKENSMSKSGKMAYKYLLELRDILYYEYSNLD